MNILDKLNKDVTYYEFKYFGSGDLASYLELEDIINNKEIIINYYSSKSFSIKSFDDYIDYLFLKKFSQFSDIIPFVKEDKKQQVEDMLKLLNNLYLKYQNKDIIKYLNNNYTNIIDNNKYNIREETLDIVVTFHSGCIKILEYYIDNYCYIIIYNFDKIQDILLKNEPLINKIFDKNHFDEIKYSGLKHYLSILSFFIKKHKINETIKSALQYVSDFANEIFKSINEDNILQYDNAYKTLVDFFVDIKDKNANDFENKFNSLESVRNAYLKKHGHEISVKIPMDEIKQYVNDEKLSMQQKIFLLTHAVRNKKFVNFLEDIGQETKRSLVDAVCSTTTPYDEYFTISKQEHLQMFTNIMNTIIQYFVNKEKIQDFISCIAGITEHICKDMNVNFKDTEFENDYNVLLNMFLNIFNAHEIKNDYLVTGLNYGITMFIFGITEKLLRYYYKFKKTDVYIKDDWFSLGHLLDINDKTMVELFGIDHLKILGYYLINSNVGYNLRNNFAHYKKIKQKDINWGVTLISLYLYIDILNQMLIKLS